VFHNTWPFIGSLGRLVEVPFTASESVSRADRYVESTTVEGVRRVQVRPAAPRSWSVDVRGASAGELSGLAAFAQGAWGAGPWHWVSVQAQRGNLLTPREAALVDVVPASFWALSGPVVDADGVLQARSLSVSLASGWAAPWRDIPVLPGRRVMWAADVAGVDGPALALAFFDVDGVQVGGFYGTARAAAGMSRVSMYAVAPAGAATVRVGVQPSVLSLTRPQVTWTDGPVPYSAGHGCRAAVVDGFSEDLLVANSSGTYSSIGFTVLEVG